LFPKLQQNIAEVLGCDSIRLLDNLQFVTRDNDGKAKKEIVSEKTNEVVRIRGGQGHELLETGGRWDPHTGWLEPTPMNEGHDIARFRFPEGEGDDRDAYEEVVESDQAMINSLTDMSIGVPDEPLYDDGTGECDPEDSVFLEGFPDISEFRFPNDDKKTEKKTEDKEQKEKEANLDPIFADIGTQGCVAPDRSLPVLHVDPWHAPELRTIREASVGKEVGFKKKEEEK